MRTGINVIPECPVGEVVAVAERAETLGFDRCWVYDEGLATRDLYVVLTAIAVATRRLELGPGITNPHTRHPAQTAAAIASLDELSGGRAFLGIGAGGSLTLDPLGIDRRRPLSAVAETIDICRGLWSGEPITHDGEVAVLRDAALSYARSDIEVWLAGRGPRMLALGGRAADGVMLDFIHKPDLGASIERVRGGGPARICYSTAVVTDDDDFEFVRPHMTYRLVDAPPPVKEAIGLTDHDADRIRSAMAGGIHEAAQHVRDEWIEPFVISGSPSACCDEIARLVDQHGIEEFLLPMFEMPDQLGYLDRVAPAVGAGSSPNGPTQK